MCHFVVGTTTIQYCTTVLYDTVRVSLLLLEKVVTKLLKG